MPIADYEVTAQIWRVDIGGIPLYLLDAERPENSQTARWITSRLYIGDEDTRLAQYMLLGIGGVRALEAMGIEPGLVHLNEGHAAFVSLELARREYSGHGSLSGALEIARKRTIFTTHTPVPAGNDTYPASQVAETLAHIAGTLGVDAEEIISLGRTNPRRAPSPSASRSSRCARRGPPTACHAGTARSRARCGTRCGPTRPSTTSRSPTSPTACTSRRGSASRCGSC